MFVKEEINIIYVINSSCLYLGYTAVKPHDVHRCNITRSYLANNSVWILGYFLIFSTVWIVNVMSYSFKNVSISGFSFELLSATRFGYETVTLVKPR